MPFGMSTRQFFDALNVMCLEAGICKLREIKMASSCDEPPVRRKRKAPDEVITKNVVVLRSSQVCEMDGVVLMPNTTLKMSDIKKNGQSGKLSFTKSTSSTEMERSLQQTFPFLAESNSRIYSAKAVDGKSKLDFCGQRRMWSGEETNRIITGNRALYIYCKEDDDCDPFNDEDGGDDLYYAEELDREAAEIDEDEYDRLFGESDNEEFDGF
ncbi:hypothetical protein AWC38_SpisGene8573 [Stylophora pistillata]|uniref:Uncharacterized protein n=1 Tax=Stylophora pistillata TaxID=50429 RepID=A0A2B4SCG6_STYPI|nr:hypothetical protein AWC38_SpisGene8573 [Stylophora pistillata]